MTAELLGDVHGILKIADAVEEHHQFVAAEPGTQVIGRPQARPNPVGQRLKHGVAGGVAVGVVHHLEPVDIAPEHGVGAAVVLGEVFDPVDRLLPIEQPGQFVRAGAAFEDPLGGHLRIDQPKRCRDAINGAILGPVGTGMDLHPMDVAALGLHLRADQDRLAEQRLLLLVEKPIAIGAGIEKVGGPVADPVALRPAKHRGDRRRHPDDRAVMVHTHHDV